MKNLEWVLTAAISSLPLPASAACPDLPGDVDTNGVLDVVDVQCAILGALWWIGGEGAAPACLGGGGCPLDAADINCDGTVDVSDVQLDVSFALAVPVADVLDANGDGCVDACVGWPGLCPPEPEDEGGLYISYFTAGTIYRYDLATGSHDLVASGMSQIGGPWYAPDGTLYVASIVADAVQKVSPLGQVSTLFQFPTAFANPRMVRPGPDGLLYVAGDLGPSNEYPIWAVSLDGQGGIWSQAPSEQSIWDVAFDDTGAVWASFQAGPKPGALYRANPDGTGWTLMAQGYGTSKQLDFGPDGRLYIGAAPSAGAGRVVVYDPATGGTPQLVHDGMPGIYALRFGPAGDYFVGYTVGGTTGVVERVTLAGERTVLLGSTFALPSGFAFGP
jgi:sugar lactone lactonase YvrE